MNTALQLFTPTISREYLVPTTAVQEASHASTYQTPEPISDNFAGQIAVLGGKCFRVEFSKSSDAYGLESSSTNKVLSFFLKCWHSIQRSFEWETRYECKNTDHATSLQAVEKLHEITTISEENLANKKLAAIKCPITGEHFSIEQAIICKYSDDDTGDSSAETTILLSLEGVRRLLLKPFFQESEFGNTLSNKSSLITRKSLLSGNFLAVSTQTYNQCSNIYTATPHAAVVSPVSTKVASTLLTSQKNDGSLPFETTTSKQKELDPVAQKIPPPAKALPNPTDNEPKPDASPLSTLSTPAKGVQAEKTSNKLGVECTKKLSVQNSNALAKLAKTLNETEEVRNRDLLINRYYNPPRYLRCPITSTPLSTKSAIKLSLQGRSLLISREGALQLMFESHYHPEKFNNVQYPFAAGEIQTAKFKRVS